MAAADHDHVEALGKVHGNFDENAPRKGPAGRGLDSTGTRPGGGLVPRGTATRKAAAPRGTSFSDAKAAENLPQKLVGTDFPGDVAQGLLGEPQIFRFKFNSLIG
jgi:hypothetical protein